MPPATEKREPYPWAASDSAASIERRPLPHISKIVSSGETYRDGADSSAARGMASAPSGRPRACSSGSRTSTNRPPSRCSPSASVGEISRILSTATSLARSKLAHRQYFQETSDLPACGTLGQYDQAIGIGNRAEPVRTVGGIGRHLQLSRRIAGQAPAQELQTIMGFFQGRRQARHEARAWCCACLQPVQEAPRQRQVGGENRHRVSGQANQVRRAEASDQYRHTGSHPDLPEIDFAKPGEPLPPQKLF